MANVTVYGTSCCEDTREARKHLEMLGIPYQFRDLDDDPDALEWVKEQNGGKRRMPTIQVDGQVLSVPTEAQLERALRSTGVLA